MGFCVLSFSLQSCCAVGYVPLLLLSRERLEIIDKMVIDVKLSNLRTELQFTERLIKDINQWQEQPKVKIWIFTYIVVFAGPWECDTSTKSGPLIASLSQERELHKECTAPK